MPPLSTAPGVRAPRPGGRPPCPAGDVEYLGRATLTCPGPTGAPVRFQGRLLRHLETGRYQFAVNRLPSGQVPADWPHSREWVPLTDLADVEWAGKSGPRGRDRGVAGG